MSKICETCDTKNRLKLCDEKEGEFKYCFRKVGSLDGVEESIQPFNELQELKNNSFLDGWIIIDSLHMVDYSRHMNLLLGDSMDYDGAVKEIPVGYVVK